MEVQNQLPKLRSEALTPSKWTAALLSAVFISTVGLELFTSKDVIAQQVCPGNIQTKLDGNRLVVYLEDDRTNTTEEQILACFKAQALLNKIPKHNITRSNFFSIKSPQGTTWIIEYKIK